MVEVEPDDEKVSRIMVQVRMLRSEAELKLRKDNFGERKRKYKTKQNFAKKAKN